MQLLKADKNNLTTWIATGIIFTVLACIALSSCKQQTMRTPSDMRLIDLLNDELNEAIIQDGFSPPASSRIYAYCNLAAFEANQIGKENAIDLRTILNEYEVEFPSANEQIDRSMVIASAFCHTARDLVYRDFIIDSLIVKCEREYGQSNAKVTKQSMALGRAIGDAILIYAHKDNYDQTRSFPLFTLSKNPGSWEPTPPTYGTPIEPYWGSLRTFIINSSDAIPVTTHAAFDTIPGSVFYELNKHVYHESQKAMSDDSTLAMHWDGDPMPPQRLKHVNLIRRQLNPVGHWLALGKVLSNQTKVSDDMAIEVYLRISLACADGMISGWHHKYEIDLIRPQTYINRYIDENWDPILVSPLFPEYPSGHSIIAGSCASIMIDIFSDTVAFSDDTQIRFGHKTRHYTSIGHAAEECADSRVVGGVHFIPAVEEGLYLGDEIGKIHHAAFNTFLK